MKYQTKRPLVIAKRRTEKLVGHAFAKSLQFYGYRQIDDLNADDVVVAGYPKSGNTWVQNLFASLVYGIDGTYLPDRVTQELVPDLDYKIIYKRVGEPMVFKTHDRPQRHFRRVILLTRDPRDVMASYVTMRLGLGKETSAEAMVLDGDGMLFGSWAEHSNEWIQNPHGSEIHIMRFEDLRSEPLATLQAALTFIGIERPVDLIQRAIDGNSIEVMRQKESALGFDKKSIQPDKWVESGSFVRDGKTRGDKAGLPPDVLDHLVSEARPAMEHFGYAAD